MEGLRWLCVLIVSTIWLHSIPEISARGCGSRLQLRSNEPSSSDSSQIDLSRLSEKQLQKLVQQLASFQAKGEKDNQDEDDADEEQEQLNTDYEEDNRGSSRPWNRVQRIIRRQLVKIPKRYLKKFLRQFGLARSIGDFPEAQVIPQLQEYYLIPLE